MTPPFRDQLSVANHSESEPDESVVKTKVNHDSGSDVGDVGST